MMSKLGCFVLLLLFHAQMAAQDAGMYSTSSISDSLKKNALAVFRLDEATLEIQSASKYNFKVHQIITLLTAESAGYLQHSIGVDKFHKLNDVQIKLYNNIGGLEKTYKKSDFEIFAAYDGISLVTDDKVMSLYTPAPSYPCTVEVMYEIKVTGYIELPDWSISNNAVSTEVFRYVVTTPSQMDIRHQTRNIDLKPEIKDSAKQKIYTWEKRNITAKAFPKGGYKRSKYMAVIQVAPNFFEYDGYKGEFKTWKSFGAWNYSLYQEASPFSNERISDIQSIASKYKEPRKKIAALYQYLKSNMRYVSIQLGIGGFKPFASKFVDEKKYGDCKALTNYMRNMLAVAGIKSYPALINAGYDNAPADPSFPSSPFNHVILCIPLASDTVWLECTSNTAEPGYLGSFTENKLALLLTEEGGKLISTPSSDYRNNQLITDTKVFVGNNGEALVVQSSKSTGSFRSTFMEINKQPEEKQKELLSEYMKYRTSDAYKLIDQGDSLHWYTSSIELSFKKFFDFKAGNKLFIQQHIYKLLTDEIQDEEKRTAEFIFEEPYSKKDIIRIVPPEGYIWENIPDPVSTEMDLFKYERQIRKDIKDNILEIETSLLLKKNILTPDEYQQAVIFFKSVASEESKKIVLTKQ